MGRVYQNETFTVMDKNSYIFNRLFFSEGTNVFAWAEKLIIKADENKKALPVFSDNALNNEM